MPWDFAMWDFEGYTPQNVDISQNIYGDGVQHLWLAASRGGALYVACNEGRMPWMSRFERIFVIMSTLPGFSDNDISIPSSDGGQVFRFDSTGRHLATVDSRNGKLVYSFEYDPNGFLSAIHDASGNIVAIERNAAGDLMAVVSPYGQRTLLETGNDGYLSAVTNPAGGKTGMSYQAGGLLTNFTDANGNSSHFTYDSLGVLLKDENAAGGFTMLTKKSGEKSDTIIDSTAEGRVRTYSTEKQPDGSMKSMVSACCGGTTASITNIDGSSRTDYADGTHITTEIGPDPRFGIGSPFVKRRTISTPGGQSNISTSSRTAILRSIGDIFSLQKLIDIDTINYRIYQTVYDDSTRTITSTSPEGRTSVSTIDTLGRVLRIEIPGLEPISFAYDPRGRLSAITEGTGADARARSFAYNSDGYVDYSQNPLSERTGFSYDLAGRITSQTLPDLRQIGFAYDAAGNVTGITPPGRPQHAFSYTPVNLQQQYDPPQLDAGPTPTSYSYDRDKKLTRITRPDGAAINFSYDGLGRIATMTTPDGTATYDYDPMKNHLNTITTADGQSLNFAYNGMLLTRTEWSGVVNDSIAFNYNNDFRITSRTVHGIMTDAYSYDNDGLLTGAGTMTFSRNAQNGLLAGTALGNVADAYQYNQFGEMAGYTAKYAGAAIISIQYQRDKLGRITEKTEATGGTTHTYHYTYNTAGYLTEVRTDGAVTGSYSYDANGNRTSYSGILGSASGTYDAQDRILAYGGATYTYTANGELSSKTDASGTTHYTYDVLGNLRQVTLPDGKIIEYIIDGQNRRIGKKINGAIAKAWIYEDQLRPAAELDGAGNIIARFIYGTKINVPEYVVKSGVTYRIITDHLGSPRMVVAANTGSVVQTIQYDEYGVALADDNPGFVPFGFAGGLYDGEAGLVRFGARDYDVSRGRLTCKDPAEFNSDICIYAYANNDPINFADPRGSVIFQVFVDGGTSRNTKKCKGSARVIKGNSNLIGKIGAFKGTAVSANSAAIIPEQFGGYSKSQISPYIKDISGVCKTTSFVGITDIIGGVSPIKGMNVRDALRQLNPGKFVVELPSAEKDLGSQEIELTVPSDVPCPEGTKEE
jgi:RHS repeat-associated protein